jgi:hypothetical protein
MEKIYTGEIQRLMPIFQAIAEGKTIQYKNGDWQDIDGDEDGLNLDTLIKYQDNYRIKPEQKYRPFKNAEECWQEMLKHQPFGWIKCYEGYLNITYVGDEQVYLADPDGGAILLDSKNSYQDNTFVDGTPFGIKVEE